MSESESESSVLISHWFDALNDSAWARIFNLFGGGWGVSRLVVGGLSREQMRKLEFTLIFFVESCNIAN